MRSKHKAVTDRGKRLLPDATGQEYRPAHRGEAGAVRRLARLTDSEPLAPPLARSTLAGTVTHVRNGGDH